MVPILYFLLSLLLVVVAVQAPFQMLALLVVVAVVVMGFHKIHTMAVLELQDKVIMVVKAIQIMLHTQLAVAVAEQEVMHLKKQILQVAMAE
jgi:hypothetical protein